MQSQELKNVLNTFKNQTPEVITEIELEFDFTDKNNKKGF